MRKELKIIQKNICIDNKRMDNYMILIFMIENKIVSFSIIAFPSWYKFWDEKFQHYPLCYN